MSNYDDTNRVSLWRNDKKGNAGAPDLKGTVNVGGTEFNISLWSNNGSANPKAPALRGSIEPKNAARRPQQGGYNQAPQQQQYAAQGNGYAQAPQQAVQGGGNFQSDEIPW